MKKAILIAFVQCICFINYAQDNNAKLNNYKKTSIGIGLGLDNGGIGVNLTTYLQKSIALFAGLGYNVHELGFNLGAKYRFLSLNNRVTPFMLAMYGYNTVILISNRTDLNKTFYGPTIGGGIDIRNKKGTGVWNLGLLIPIRMPEVDNYINDMKQNSGVAFDTPLSPISYTVSYRFWIN